MRVTLDEEDFRALVSGEEIEKEVTVDNGGQPATLALILEDIGFQVMSDSVREAFMAALIPR